MLSSNRCLETSKVENNSQNLFETNLLSKAHNFVTGGFAASTFLPAVRVLHLAPDECGVTGDVAAAAASVMDKLGKRS